MQRLLHSSKFWVMIFGGVILAFLNIVWPAMQAQLNEWLVLYPVAAPILYALLTALEDIADKWRTGAVVDYEDLVDVLRDTIIDIVSGILTNDPPNQPGEPENG